MILIQFSNGFGLDLLIMEPSGDLGDVHLDRKEAMAMLKALADSNLVEPSYVHICLRKPNHYQIQIKCDYYKTEIEAYAKKYGLTITEDKERKYLVIYKP